jgi:hypothetical protein
MEKTIPNWADACGLKQEDLLTQYEVAVFEACEIIEAIAEKDLVEVLDGISDLSWMSEMVQHLSNGERSLELAVRRVIAAAEKSFGSSIRENLQKSHEAVLKSNYSKFCTSKKQLEETIAKYQSPNIGIDVEFERIGDVFVVRSAKNQTGHDNKDYGQRKILKSTGYFEPDYSFLH